MEEVVTSRSISPKHLIEQAYPSNGTRHLIRQRSALALPPDRSAEPDLYEVYNEGFKQGGSLPINEAHLILNSIGSLDKDAAPIVDSMSGGEIGMTLASILRAVFELTMPLILHQCPSIRKMTLVKIENYIANDPELTTCVSDTMNDRYLSIKQEWVIQFFSVLRRFSSELHLKTKQSSQHLDISYDCAQVAFKYLTRAPAMATPRAVSKGSTTGSLILSELELWIEHLELVSRSRPERMAASMLFISPYWIMASIRLTDDGNNRGSLTFILAIIAETLQNIPDGNRMTLFLPHILIRLADYFPIGLSLGKAKYNDVFWQMLDQIVSLFQSSEQDGRQGDVDALTYALWRLSDFALIDPDTSERIKIGYYMSEHSCHKQRHHNKTEYMRDHFIAYQRRRERLSHVARRCPRPRPLTKLMRFTKFLMNYLITRISDMPKCHRKFIAPLLISLNDKIALAVTLSGFDSCGCIAGASTSTSIRDCFCDTTRSLLTMLQNKLPQLFEATLKGSEEESSDIYDWEEKDDVLIAFIFLTDELRRIEQQRWKGWTGGWAALLNDVRRYTDEILFHEVTKIEHVTDQLEVYETFLLHRCLVLGNHKGQQEPDPGVDEKLEKICAVICSTWFAPCGSNWRVKQKALSLLLLVTQISIATHKEVQLKNIIRIALEGLLYPVADIRFVSHRLLRMLGRQLVPWNVDRLSNSVVAPMLAVVHSNSLELKTEDPTGAHAQRWRMWCTTWNLGMVENPTKEGLLKYPLDPSTQFGHVLYKQVLSAYRGLMNFIAGLHQGSSASSQNHLPRLMPLLNTIEAQLVAGLSATYHESIAVVVRGGIDTALQEWHRVKSS